MSWAEEPSCSSRQALDGLREAGRLLERPTATAVEASSPHLEAAGRYLSALETQLRREPPTGEDRRRLRGEIDQIRREVRRVKALMENAGRFYMGLGQFLAEACGAPTYTPGGRLDPGAARPRLQVEG